MKELSPPPLNLRRLYAETLEWEPVLILISPGADPSQELAELAVETVGRENYHEVDTNKIKRLHLVKQASHKRTLYSTDRSTFNSSQFNLD